MNSKIIICDRYDIEGVKERVQLIIKENPDYFIHFFESMENPGYYLIYSGCEYDGEALYHHLNNTGECDFGDGAGRANVADPTSIGIFEFNINFKSTA